MLQTCRHWLAFAFLSLFSTAAPAGEPSQGGSGSEPPVLNLNVSTAGYPPYLIVTPDHQYGGIVYEVITRIAEGMGYRVEAHEIPRKRADSLLRKGLIDATPRAREWTENPEQFLFTDAMVPIREVFFTTTDSGFRFRGLDKLNNVTLVTPLGYHYPELEPLFESGAIERYEVSEDRDIFTFLLHSRGIDAGVADMAVGQWIIRQNGWQGKFRHSEQAISEVGYRLMLRPEWSSFAEAFNRELAKMKASGELDQILDQYR